MTRNWMTEPPQPLAEGVLCGLLVQVGAVIPGPRSWQGQLPRERLSPRDNQRLTHRTAPPHTKLGALEPRSNTFDAARNLFNGVGGGILVGGALRRAPIAVHGVAQLLALAQRVVELVGHQ